MQLHVSQLSAGYGARTIVRDISFTLHRGEVLVVSGPNGSGKSTVLRILAGLQAPTSGVAYYEAGGTRFDPRDARHLIGWVAPDLALYRELSGIENLRFFARVRGLAISDAALYELLTRVGLGKRGDDRLAAYSSGMAQRLRYAFALLHRPPVLLLDEPTVTLDEQGAAVVDQIIADQRRHGLTVIATNDPRELRYADLILRLGGSQGERGIRHPD
ncbi:ABC transporter ATP-binding protein [uncultured Chloroflexus sp.]|uniref:ABC transporter ATP-binding protein n=1 Tax=uncultured Chloroflexus sp. TaxID=214040 RepID=UPI0026257FAA|nr:ABC transporter ATP-binding protein [uncultured Chloroflexus sp.]